MIQHPRDTVMTSEQIAQIASILNAAFDNGVTHVINVGTTYNETVNSIAIAQKYPNVYATAGIHPCDVKRSWKEDFAALKRLIKQHRSEIVAIGETGLDYYHQPYDKEAQISLFHAHIQFAIEHEMPLVIHIRQAGDDALAILDQYKGETRGVVHCFSLDLEAAEQIKAWGVIGILVSMGR